MKGLAEISTDAPALWLCVRPMIDNHGPFGQTQG
jgi:hypothetical protein